jgi:uncharacterized protein (TIGR02268 family)
MTGAARFVVTADASREAREVRIRPYSTLTFVFDTSVHPEGVVLEGREHFRQVSLSEDGLMLNLLLSGELPPGQRLTLTVRFADGRSPASLSFTLVVHPQAEHQVEVFRRPRPGDSYKREAEEAEARLQRCQSELARERTERDAPRGLLRLLVLKQMNEEGVLARDITEDLSLRRGETFQVRQAISYRATGGEEEAKVVQLAVALELRNKGAEPWTAAGAELVGPGGRWKMELWSLEPIIPGAWRYVRVQVELPAGEARGPYRLQLWDESGARTLTLAGVTFS